MAEQEGTAGVGYAASPFADAVLTPTYAVASTGADGDRAVPRDRTPLRLTPTRRPVIDVGQRLPLLTGRKRELDELSELVRRGESVEVHGAEGFGKTSLMNLLLHERPELKSFFSDGVIVLSGRTIAPGDLVGSMFRAFFTTDQSIALDDAEMLRHLSPVRALVILDDVELDGDRLQEILVHLTSPVVLVTSNSRRLHDFGARLIGPLDDDDVVAAAELRLGHELDSTERGRVLALSHLVDDRPRSFARALELVEDGTSAEELDAMATRLQTARDTESETARLAFDQIGNEALAIVALLSALGARGLSEEMIENVLGIEFAGTPAAEIETMGLGQVVDGLVTVDPEIASIASESMDGDRVAIGAFDRMFAWSEQAQPEQLVEEAAGLTAFAKWGAENDRSPDVITLGRRLDRALFAAGRWGPSLAVLAVVAGAAAGCGRPADQAWALHQMGVRELALGRTELAKRHLKDARAMRRRLGDKTGEALTHEHLRLLGPLASVASGSIVKIAAGAAIVIAVAVGAWIAFASGGDSVDLTTGVGGGGLVRDAPTLSVELVGNTSVAVTVSMPADLEPGETVQVNRTAPDGTEEIVLDSATPETTLDRDLAPSTTYEYRVRVVGDGRQGTWSEATTITTGDEVTVDPPDKPTGLIGVFVDDTVELTWDESSADDVAGYDVLRDGALIEQSVDANRFVDDDPATGVTHDYQVVAFDEAGNLSDPSDSVSVEIPGPAPPPPPAPTDLAWDYDQATGLTLTWSGDGDSFRVDRTGWLRSRSVSQPRIVDEDVSPGDTVTYEVRAVVDAVPSEPAALEVTVDDVPPPVPVPAPGRPTLTEVDGVIRVEWQAPTYGFPLSYRVNRNGQTIASPVIGTRYDDRRPADGSYDYTVVAVNSDGVRSQPSPSRAITVGTTTTSTDPQQREVTVSVVGQGTVESTPGGIDCPSICTDEFDDGARVTLSATPASGWEFDRWSGDCSGRGTCRVDVDSAISVSATFTATPDVELTVDLAGSGTGTVTSNPGGLTCNAGECTGTFTEGDKVTLTASGTNGSSFDGWSGSGCSGSGACMLTLDSDVDVQASFSAAPAEFTLSVSVGGGGTGSVSSSIGNISCPPTCSDDYTDGDEVTLTATPTGSSTFAGWTGAGCPAAGTCTVTMDAAKAVQATFDTPPPVTLTVTIEGATGTVSSSPGTLSCNASACTGSFPDGSDVTLSASPTGDSDFVGWLSGAGCNGLGDCVLTMDGNTDFSAFFEDNTPPAAPSGLSYDPVADLLSWSASPSADVEEYAIYYDGIFEATVSSGTTSFTPGFCDTDYTVRAVDDGLNESGDSNSANVPVTSC